jgi:uncharacterized coiled-coil protein SlyX
MSTYEYEDLVGVSLERRMEQLQSELELKNKLIEYYKGACGEQRLPGQRLMDKTISELNRLKELYDIQQETIEALSKRVRRL